MTLENRQAAHALFFKKENKKHNNKRTYHQYSDIGKLVIINNEKKQNKTRQLSAGSCRSRLKQTPGFKKQTYKKYNN